MKKYRIKKEYYIPSKFYKGTHCSRYVPQKRFILWWFDLTETFCSGGDQYRAEYQTEEEAIKKIESDIGEIILHKEIIK